MKFISVLVVGFLFFNQSFSQSLEGEWRGSFTYADVPYLETSFALHFTLKKDSSYKVYTYSRQRQYDGLFITVVCEASCRVISGDSILIEEVKQVKPPSAKADGFQRMHLTIRTKAKKRIMEGWWEETVNSKYGGSVLLTKK